VAAHAGGAHRRDLGVAGDPRGLADRQFGWAPVGVVVGPEAMVLIELTFRLLELVVQELHHLFLEFILLQKV
jgi:hypothetical protein